ncbi:CinA family protein [Dyella sp. 2HG41-7]|uniref:CinA family protein n=1 Tax=Dyella sp. 2HG41-7 TaxID=2883239 RepID=UPI001F322025|nr:CinA family protein [Dyella sp. 2HG41-7]
MEKSFVPTDAELAALAVCTAAAMQRHSSMLASAESCTGGWIAKTLTDLSGSSAWFEAGVVSYSNAAKMSLLGVRRETLERFGAVSKETALEMASGAVDRLNADVAVAVTGIAGPTGGTPDKPVGTVWIGWARRSGAAHARLFHFEGDREAVRRQTVAEALEGVLAILTN